MRGAVGGLREGAAGGVWEGAVGGVWDGVAGGVWEGAAGGVWAGLGPISQNYQLHLIFYFNYNYTHNFPNQLQLHCFNYNDNCIMRNQIYSAFVNYVFLHVLLNFNVLYTIDKQI